MQNKIGLFITVTLFLLLGLCYSYYTPLWNPPDEERHFAYCEYIAQNHKLPEYRSDSEANNVSMAFHPPLYYLIGSLFCKDDGRLLEEEIAVNDGPGFTTIVHKKEETEFPYSGKARSAYLLRFFSLVLSALNICLIYLLVLKIFPGETILASATALFVATIPQFMHFSASVSNETIASTLSTAYLLSLLYYLENPFKLVRQIASGVLLGCCLLSKTTTIFYPPVTAFIICWVSIRNKKKFIKSFFVILGIATFIAGWWYILNWLISGDPFSQKTVATLNPWFPRRTPLPLSSVIMLIGKTFTSFFGDFGALQIPIAKLHLSIYGGILLFGFIGLCRLLLKIELSSFQREALIVLFLSLLGAIGIFTWINFKYVGLFMGRYLFVVIGPIAILIFAGLRFLFPLRLRNIILIALSLALLTMNLDTLFRTLKTAYGETCLAEGADQPHFSKPTVEINNATTIAQSFFSPQNNLSAIRLMLSNPTKPQSGDIIFSIKEATNTKTVLRQISFPVKKTNDNTRYFFIFPPIKNSKNKEYLLSISSTSLSAGKGTSLWYESSDCYHDGHMFVNGAPTDGDIYFTAYHFTGEYPKTDWQGKREIVIKQGFYVGIRELQLYQERSEEFRVRTITHQKLKRLEKAIKNRKSLMEHK